MIYIKKDNPDMKQALTVGLYNYLRKQDFEKHNFNNRAWKIIENVLVKELKL